MKFREFLFWFLVFILCFLAGYLKGYLPEEQFKEILGTHTQIRILAIQQSLLPQQFIEKLEIAEDAEIIIESCQSWQECSVNFIANPGYTLILIPYDWLKKLIREETINNLNPLIQLLEKNVHPDFLISYNQVYYFAPYVWKSDKKLEISGFVIPKNTPHLAKSIELLATILNPDFQLDAVKFLNDYSTPSLTLETTPNLQKEKKASYLRELNLKEYLQLRESNESKSSD